MGFICFPLSDAVLPTTVVTVVQLLDIILGAVSVALYRLGLNPSFVPTPWENEEFLFSAGPTPSALVDAALVKSRLQAVPYRHFVGRKGCGGVVAGAAPPECVVCLEYLEAMDDVRVLGNCNHVFHVACIDRWVDLGQFSCPLCRAELLPVPAAAGGLISFLKVVAAGWRRSC